MQINRDLRYPRSCRRPFLRLARESVSSRGLLSKTFASLGTPTTVEGVLCPPPPKNTFLLQDLLSGVFQNCLGRPPKSCGKCLVPSPENTFLLPGLSSWGSFQNCAGRGEIQVALVVPRGPLQEAPPEGSACHWFRSSPTSGHPVRGFPEPMLSGSSPGLRPSGFCPRSETWSNSCGIFAAEAPSPRLRAR